MYPRRGFALRVEEAGPVKDVVVRRGLPPAAPSRVCKKKRDELVRFLSLALLTRPTFHLS